MYVKHSNDMDVGRWRCNSNAWHRDRLDSWICTSYKMGCPPLRGDNPRALASGLSYVQVDKHGITILYHQHQCRPCTSRDISC